MHRLFELNFTVFYRMVPLSVNSLMIRLLVPDASPDKPIQKLLANIKTTEEIPSKNNNSLTNTVTKLNHRVVVEGKHL